MTRITPRQWAERAEALRPNLYRETLAPVHTTALVEDKTMFQGWRMKPVEESTQRLDAGSERCWDFGRHMLGHLSFRVALAGTRQDAPVKLRVTFGEMPCELAEPFSDYRGCISAAWLQEETLILDRVPQVVKLPRRYAFRYVKVEILAASSHFGVYVDDLRCEAMTSADTRQIASPAVIPEKYQAIDRAALDTLRDCMLEIFEDGPKRDRRLWLGDLRLQALASYSTYRRDDLVKRCLCMFAASPLEDGRMAAAIYDCDPPLNDESCLADYALLFVSALWDCCEHVGDIPFVEELYPVARDQLEIAHASLSPEGIMTFEEGFTCFIDWCETLDRHAALQGVYLYALNHGIQLAEALGRADDAATLRKWYAEAKQAAIDVYWDEALQRFVCGKDRQISWASQIWMVLGGALEPGKARQLLISAAEHEPPVDIATPYLKHYHLEALLYAGMAEEALRVIDTYWGGMVRLGADTFWEIYCPENPSESPYGSYMSHSYCHAWSCTPAYFLRRIFG
ncbi:MAG: sugar hydrolase [Candidatus Faecivicinus sp.]